MRRPVLMVIMSSTLLGRIFLSIGEVRELSHLDMDEVLKTIGEIYEQEY